MDTHPPAAALGAAHTRQLVSLEWLRFGLGVYLVLFHTLNGFNYPGIPESFRRYFDLGFFSTSTFFVLSGFLLAHVYLKDHATPDAMMKGARRTFWVKRFANLYPIHMGSFFMMVAIFLALPALGMIPGDEHMSLWNVYPDTNDWKEAVRHEMTVSEMSLAVVMNALLLHAWNPFYLAFNIPSWSISTLMFLYLLFPFVAPALHRVKRAGTLLVVINVLYLVPVIAFIGLDWYGSPATGFLHRNPLIRMPEFMAGIVLCAFYHQQLRLGVRPTQRMIVILIGYVMASLVGAGYLLHTASLYSSKGNIPYFLLHDGLMLPAQLALIYVMVQLPNPSQACSALAKRLGNCSLSLFAIHIPVFIVYARLDRVLSGNPGLCLSSLKECFAAASGINIWHYPIYLVGVVLLSLAFQKHFVERMRRVIEHGMLGKHQSKATVPGAHIALP